MMKLIQFIKSLVIRSDDLQNKSIVIVPDGSANTETTLISSQTSDVTVVIPNQSGTISLVDGIEELENKTIDAEKNDILNLTVDNFKLGTIVNDLSGTPTNDELVTAAGIRFAFDNQFIRREIYTLTLADITDNSAEIVLPSDYANILYILPIGGVEVIFGIDAILVPLSNNSFTLDWTGLEASEVFAEGDELLIVYTEQNFV